MELPESGSAISSPLARSSVLLLIIDNSKTDREIYKHYLQGDKANTYHILEAETIALGQKLWQGHHPDVVLLDLHFPDGSGLDLLAAMAKEYPDSQVPTIVVAGEGDEHSAVRAMKLGAADYLAKPGITEASLQNTVQQALESTTLSHQLLRSQQQTSLIADIALRVHQCHDLEAILETTVAAVQSFLVADRVIVYQFDSSDMSGTITAEAVVPPWIPCRTIQIKDTCFQEGKGERYHQGCVFVADDIYAAGLSPCHIALLEQFQIRANLVVPILRPQAEPHPLWGLLIAQQCSGPRHWIAADVQLLKQLSVQVAIAIQRAELYGNLQTLNASLDRQVQARTQDLEDSRNRFQAIFNNMFQLTGLLSPDGTVLEANQTALQVGGLCREEVIGRPFWETHWWQTSPAITAQLQVAIARAAQGEFIRYEVEILTANQTVTPIDFSLRPITDKAGQVVLLIPEGRDLTEAKHLQAEREQAFRLLQESEHRYASLAAAAPVGIFRIDASGYCTYVNERYCQITGLSPVEAAGQGWQQWIHPEDRAPALAAWEAAAMQAGIHQFECRFQQNDGSVRWVYIQILVHRDADNHLRDYIGTMTDISDRKQAEAERLAAAQMRQELHLLENILDVLLAGYWDWDIVQNHMYLSPGLQRILGYEPQELPSTPAALETLIFPKDQALVRNQFRSHIDSQGQIPYVHEARYQHKDGSLLWGMCSGKVIEWDKAGNPLRMVGGYIDISDRKRAEIKMEQQLAAIESASDGIGILQNNHYIYVNQAHLTLFGYQHADQLIGQPWRILYSPEKIAYFEQAVFPCLAQDRHWRGEITAQKQNGAPFEQELSLTLTEEDLLICVCRDISDRKAAEAQLRLTNQKLERATRLKDEFLATMSHELRTPLNAILGMSEGLQNQVFGALNHRQHQALQTIELSGTHLLSLISDILDLSKIESGFMELDLMPVDLRQICCSSIDLIKQQARKKNLQLQVQLPDRLPPIAADERRIRQVMINLVTNAVKFTPEGGSITVAVLPSPKSDDASPPFLRIAVTDTGIGIAPENLTRLFQPFVQVDGSLSRQYEGTGLGLALVRRIAELHGGKVAVTSQLGAGSCFTVDLPVADSSAPTVKADEAQVCAPISPLPPETAPLIILAEDNEANTFTIRSYLEARGYRVLTAKNGYEAITIARETPPDLVLMDIQMPFMDGLTATRMFRHDPNLSQLPILALTALAMEEEQERCLAAGVNQVITKPARMKDLVTQIQALLSPS